MILFNFLMIFQVQCHFNYTSVFMYHKLEIKLNAKNYIAKINRSFITGRVRAWLEIND